MLNIQLEDLDEHNLAEAVAGGTVSVYTDPSANDYVKEDAKIRQ